MKLTLYVQPGAKKTEVVGRHDGHLKIRLQAPAVDDKANQLLRETLARRLSIKVAEVIIVHGDKSRLKTVEITASAYQTASVDAVEALILTP